MFWKRARDFARTLGFRLNLWYAAIFIASAALLFGLIYYLLGAAIDRKDRDVIEARLHEYAAIYKRGGVTALQAWVHRVDEARMRRVFFVRVARPDRTLQFLAIPDDWAPGDLSRLDYRGKYRLDPWLRAPRDDESDLTVASTFLSDGAFIQVGRSSDSESKLLLKFRHVFAVVISPVLLLGVLGGALLSRRMTSPLSHLAAVVRAIINTGQMNVRVPVRRANDELHELAVLFNRMLDGNEALIRALREALDNVAHDLRTPLSRLRVRVEDALRHPADTANLQEALADALEETERVETIIRTLMDVAQAQAGVLNLDVRPVDLGALVDEGIELYEHVASEKEVRIEKRFDELLVVPGDRARLRQVFANLLDNAIKYTPRGGKVVIAARRDLGEAVVSFHDTGIGIAPEELPRIWERLYRGDTSRAERGLGLGLSLVKAMTEAHGGRVEAEGAPGKGAEFRVRLPLGG